ncbi:MAG TPA: HPP family protein [Steroidobacteraceae bacterium]|nr:HPP family protein [Steroidobacteraceae bacterium]
MSVPRPQQPQQPPTQRAAAVRRAPAPEWIVAPLATALALVLPGVIALLTHRVFLFASLGPTAVTLAHQPLHPSARAYNAVLGHLLGLGVGFAVVAVLGLAYAPSVFELHAISGARVGAALLAIALAVLGELLLNARHPPAAATTLLVALGSFHPTATDSIAVVGGVLSLVIAAELVRRARLLLGAVPPGSG